MAETPPRHRLPTLWRWLLGVSIPAPSLILAIVLSYLLDSGWPLLIFPLGLASGSGIIAGCGAVSLRFGRKVTYAVAVMSLSAWFIAYWISEASSILAIEFFLGIFLAIMFVFLSLALIFTLPIGFGIALGVAVAHWRTVGTRVAYPVIVYLGIAVLAWVLPFGPYGGLIRLPSAHSDAAMEANFWQHREQLEQLVQMFNEDTMMHRITHEFTWPENAVESGFAESRWGQYRSLFRQTGIVGGLIRFEDGTINFTYWGGLLFSGKGYVYSEKLLQPVVASLDDMQLPSTGNRLYKKLTGNWYMYRYWDDD